MFENVTESRRSGGEEMAARKKIAASQGAKERGKQREERWKLKKESMCMRPNTRQGERSDYSGSIERKREGKRERRSKKEKRRYGGEGEIRKDESERVEGESNVSECMAMERL